MAAGFEAFTRGDIQTMLANLDPEVEWEETAEVAFIGLDRVYRGHDGFLRWVQDVMEVWGELETRVGDVMEGRTGLVIETILRGRGQKSGIEVEQTMYNVLSFRDGLIVRRQLFLDRAAALEAVNA
jgi:ketosteroid isomerase-like protein